MATELEVVNCRRFLQAWARYRDAQAPQQDAETLYQYRLMAQHFQQLVKQTEGGDKLKAIEVELAPVVKQIEHLASQQDDVFMRFRVPSFARRHPWTKAAARLSPRSTGQSPREPTVAKEKEAVDEVAPPGEDRPEGRLTSEWELDARDFEAMLDAPPAKEEKLTTRAIRKRLGLVDRCGGGQKSASEAVAQAEQEALQSEMAELAKQLKERTQTINQSLVDDVKILDAVGESAESNTTLLDRENEVLKKQLASSIGLWTTLWLIAMAAVVFVIMYLFMKVFSRRW